MAAAVQRIVVQVTAQDKKAIVVKAKRLDANHDGGWRGGRLFGHRIGSVAADGRLARVALSVATGAKETGVLRFQSQAAPLGRYSGSVDLAVGGKPASRFRAG